MTSYNTMSIGNFVFGKTEIGREEIEKRHHGLVFPLRTLLVLIDGKASLGELLQKTSGFGIDEHSFIELAKKGFIKPLASNQKKFSEMPNAEISPPSLQKPVNNLESDVMVDSAATTTTDHSDADKTNKILAVKNFFDGTVKSTMGLRGIGFQLKVERACTLDDFYALRDEYFNAVSKAKGKEIAISLQARLDEYLRM